MIEAWTKPGRIDAHRLLPLEAPLALLPATAAPQAELAARTVEEVLHRGLVPEVLNAPSNEINTRLEPSRIAIRSGMKSTSSSNGSTVPRLSGGRSKWPAVSSGTTHPTILPGPAISCTSAKEVASLFSEMIHAAEMRAAGAESLP